jgi:hypothetical protein
MSELIVIPEEVNNLAVQVSEEKQQEVKDVLNQIFTGTSEWEKQVDEIVVKDVNDTMSINLADAARKNAKTARLNAEKLFDAKRSEVQAQMRDYKLEDSLWLKSKQIMQIKFKAIEEKAKFKADFVKRHEAEQRELVIQLRLEKVSKFNPEINRVEIEGLSDSMFDVMLQGLEKTHNDKIEAEKKAEEERKENERLNKIEQERRLELAPYAQFITESNDLRNMPDNDYKSLLNSLIEAKKAYEAEQEKIRIENERLKKEAEEKERKRLEEEKARKLQAEKEEQERKAKAEAERKVREEKERKEREAYEAKLKAEREERERIEREERIKREKIEAELKAKEEAERKRLAEEKAKKDAEEAERKRIEAEQRKAEKAARLAPDKQKLAKLSQDLLNYELPEVKSDEAKAILTRVKTLLGKISTDIVEQSKSI